VGECHSECVGAKNISFPYFTYKREGRLAVQECRSRDGDITGTPRVAAAYDGNKKLAVLGVTHPR
jgi:hypothetical protein